jgi:dTDP-4-amino-4,6-dideoxygalactose transaminase
MAPKVPLLDLQTQYAAIRTDVLQAIARVCDAQRFILGPEVDALEKELEAFLEVPHAVGMSSGTDALLAAMMMIDVGAGDEVVTTPYTFFATAGSAARLGARVVFVDIDPVTFNLNPEHVARAITPRTKAIVPVHMFGQSADLGPILEIADRSGTPVIEDAAQAIGARYRDRPVGTYGLCACFSFFPTKNLGAFGDGGLVTTRDSSMAAKLRSVRQHGSKVKYHHEFVGANFRLDELQAAVLRVKLSHLAAWTAARQRNAERYDALFAAARLHEHVRLPQRAADRTHVFHQFVIRVRQRDRLRAHLETQGIDTEIYYPVPLHLQPCFSRFGYTRGSFPEAEAAADEALALPIYPELSSAQQESVVEAIRTFFESAN